MADETEELDAKTALDAASEEETDEASPQAGGRLARLLGSRLTWIGAGGAALAILAGVGFVFFSSTPESAHVVADAEAAEDATDSAGQPVEVASGYDEAASPAPAPIGEVFALDTFIVNIEDHNRDRYLKLKTELEVSGSEVSEELRGRMPQVRDLILSLLGSKSFEEVRTIEGKNFLREEILLRLNALLIAGKVRRVFFTEFVVQ